MVIRGKYILQNILGTPPPPPPPDVPVLEEGAEWPGPIVAVGSEVGDAVLFCPAASIEKDFGWSEAHPVVDAYRAHREMPYDAPTTAMAAVLYAVRAKANLSGYRNRVRLPFWILIVDPAQKAVVQQTYIEIASAKPVPRAPCFRRPVQQEQQASPPPQKKQ